MIEDERRTSPLHCFILAMNMQIASHTSDHLANESWCSWLGWCRCCRGPRLVRPRNVRGRGPETRPGCLRNSPPHRWRQPILTLYSWDTCPQLDTYISRITETNTFQSGSGNIIMLIYSEQSQAGLAHACLDKIKIIIARNQQKSDI